MWRHLFVVACSSSMNIRCNSNNNRCINIICPQKSMWASVTIKSLLGGGTTCNTMASVMNLVLLFCGFFGMLKVVTTESGFKATSCLQQMLLLSSSVLVLYLMSFLTYICYFCCRPALFSWEYSQPTTDDTTERMNSPVATFPPVNCRFTHGEIEIISRVKGTCLCRDLLNYHAVIEQLVLH